MEVYTSYINGAWLPAGEVEVRRKPGHLDEVACRYCLVGTAEATAAMDAAQAAFPGWRSTPAAERIQLLGAWLDRIERETEAYAEIITAENGKGLDESRAEVAAALRDGRFLLDVAAEDLAEQPTGNPYIEHLPLGVFLLILPWNFPLSTFIRKLVPALVYGNTGVVKSSEITPGPSWLGLRHLDDLNLPPGVANLVMGKGRVVGPAMVDYPALAGISLTGSTETGLRLQAQTAGRNVKLQLELGGKNALVVLGDADLDAAVEAACVGGFSCAGQWCTGTSRVVVEAAVYPEFQDKLVRRAATIEVGPGHLPGYQMGPVAYEGHFNEILEAMDQGRRQGARCLLGGRAVESVEGCRGWFIEPSIFGGVTETMALFQEEVFGPVLALTEAADGADAVRLANASIYGLSASVFTRDVERGKRVLARIETGLGHVNLHTAYRTADMPFSGWKESGRGVPECGPFAQSFYTQPRALYIGT